MTTQELNKEAATVSPVVSISSKYETQEGQDNYAVNFTCIFASDTRA
jgi:hypothetical protein